jgi:uncharacterized protein (DUF924 family)
MNARITEILETWFGPRGSDPMAQSSKWFRRDAAFDAEIRRRFEHDIDRASRGELDAWRRDGDEDARAHGALALVILIDQFSRNAFRDTPRAFAGDAHALAVSRELQREGLDRRLGLVERAFLLMPMQHAESREVQHAGIAAFDALSHDAEQSTAPTSVREMIASFAKYARRHAAIIDRFGRFPHRNAILGRASTDDEIEFLKQPGSSF